MTNTIRTNGETPTGSHQHNKTPHSSPKKAAAVPQERRNGFSGLCERVTALEEIAASRLTTDRRCTEVERERDRAEAAELKVAELLDRLDDERKRAEVAEQRCANAEANLAWQQEVAKACGASILSRDAQLKSAHGQVEQLRAERDAALCARQAEREAVEEGLGLALEEGWAVDENGDLQGPRRTDWVRLTEDGDMAIADGVGYVRLPASLVRYRFDLQRRAEGGEVAS